jgi:hypothetical protein
MLTLISFCFVHWADAEVLSEEYFHGRWAIDADDCRSPNSEYIVFSGNGTFESTRTGMAEIVGFWKLDHDILDLHMVTSPAFFDDIHLELREYGGTYNYYHARMHIFNNKKERHEAIGIIGNEMKRMSAVRCR